MTLLHCNILSDFSLFWPRLETKCRQTENLVKKNIYIIFSKSQLSKKKKPGRYRLDFDPHYPLLLILLTTFSYKK